MTFTHAGAVHVVLRAAGKAPGMGEHINRLSIVVAKSCYGFVSEPSRFVKIEFLDPSSREHAVTCRVQTTGLGGNAAASVPN